MPGAPRGIGEDLTWAIRLVRQGHDRSKVIAALTRCHPKHGYHSIVYGELVKDRSFGEATRYAEGTTDKAIRIAKEDPRVMDPHEARIRLAEIEQRRCGTMAARGRRHSTGARGSLRHRLRARPGR